MLYLADDSEAVAFIERDVSRIRTFEVGGDTFLIASSKRMFHQQRAEALADPAWIGANERQIPMWLVGMMLGHSLQHVAQIIGDIRTQGLRCDCGHGRFIRLDAGWQPQRSRAGSIRDVGCAMRECPAAKRRDELRHDPEIFG